MKIKNTEQLLAHGVHESRRFVLNIVEGALDRVDGYKRISAIARMEGPILWIGTASWDLSSKRHVYLLGAGKACNAMALAIEHVLGEWLTRGIAIVKIAEPEDGFERTEVHVGGHPLPNAAGAAATQEILELVDGAGPDDLFIAVMSGGSSALMNCPVPEVSVADEAAATDVLLKSGADIRAINAVRRHISRTNGGRLAQRILGVGAELIGIGISDAVGKASTADIAIPVRDYTATPIGPDPTTFEDARQTIIDFDLATRLPPSVVAYLQNAGPQLETPKALPGATYFVINTLPDIARAAVDAASDEGVNAVVLSTFLEGESRDAGTFLAAVAREVQANGRPFAAPCVLVSAGETVTTITDDGSISGHGGPSTELALAFALSASSIPGACVYAMDSEGTDGTSPAAGGLTDSTSLARARDAGVDLRQLLRAHASHEALTSIGDAVITGNTGTNLCDLNILYVPAVSDTTDE